MLYLRSISLTRLPVLSEPATYYYGDIHSHAYLQRRHPEASNILDSADNVSAQSHST